MTRERIKYMAEISNNEWDLREDIYAVKQAITQAKQIATLSRQRIQEIAKRQRVVGLNDVQMKNLITEELAMKRLHNRFRAEANRKTKIYKNLKKQLPHRRGVRI